MKRFFDRSAVIVTPADLVVTFTRQDSRALELPPRAIISFDRGDAARLLREVEAEVVGAWRPFRTIYRLAPGNVVLANCPFGGPNVAALMEEFTAFGVREFVLWGYCGTIGRELDVGDVLAVTGALREDGLSHHYVDTDEEMIFTPWFDAWKDAIGRHEFQTGPVWSTDAIYRETVGKVDAHQARGIVAVEMEVASCYAVAAHLGVNAIAFLVVSDSLRKGRWEAGFHGSPLKVGVKRMIAFLLAEAIR